MSSSDTGTSISKRNMTHDAFYKRFGRRATLLVHPHGMKLLEKYKEDKARDKDQEEIDYGFGLNEVLVDRLCRDLSTCIKKPEPDISAKLHESLTKNWDKPKESKVRVTITGEHAETITGELSQEPVKGFPGLVLRIANPNEDGAEADKVESNGNVEIRKHPPVAIFELSVDNNGREKKISQAFDYGTLIECAHKTMILFTLHIDRGGNITATEAPLKVTQQAFLFVNESNEGKNKVAFLWRECYQADSEKEIQQTLRSSCKGIIRCLSAALYLVELNDHPEQKESHKVVSDNVAIVGDHVYKIFDNRFHPTQRRLANWIPQGQGDETSHPWIVKLNVEEFLSFDENSDSRWKTLLGDPVGLQKALSDCDAPVSPRKKQKVELELMETPYMYGSVSIIKYDYQDGTHYASKASHFQQIAKDIQAMHEEGFVHGDVRAFNMLHPDPAKTDGIQQSCLIDFDLAGKVDNDDHKYPVGYAEKVPDSGYRYGRAGEKLQKNHDWADFAEVLSFFRPTGHVEEIDAWEQVAVNILSATDGRKACESIRTFVEKYGDVNLKVNQMTEIQWEKLFGQGDRQPQQETTEIQTHHLYWTIIFSVE